MPLKHYVFYDGECPFCQRAVRVLLDGDRKKELGFAPLQGSTAWEKLPPYRDALRRQGIVGAFSESDSLIVLINGSRMFVRSQAVLAVFWELGGWYRCLGCLHFLPGWLYNWLYRFIAKRRKKLFKGSCPLPPPSKRDQFLS